VIIHQLFYDFDLNKYLKEGLRVFVMLFFFDIFFKLFREVFAVAQLPIN
jgi:hypothetical protein